MQSIRFVLRTICPPLIKSVRTICLRTICPRLIRAKKQSVRFIFRTICLQTIFLNIKSQMFFVVVKKEQFEEDWEASWQTYIWGARRWAGGQDGQWAGWAMGKAGAGVTEETEQGCDPSHICPSRPTFAQSTQTLLKTKSKCFHLPKFEKVGPGAAMQFQFISKSNHHNVFAFSFCSAPSSSVRRSSKECTGGNWNQLKLSNPAQPNSLNP